MSRTRPVLTSLHLMPASHLIQADFSDDTHCLVPVREPHDHVATAYALRVLAEYVEDLPHMDLKP